MSSGWGGNTIISHRDRAELAQRAAERICRSIGEATAARGACAIALAGGSTPRDTYERLAAPPLRDQVDWSRLHVFWGDERCVPPDDARSNYRMVREALLSRVPIPETDVHRMRGEASDLDAAAREYEAEIRRLVPAEEGRVPRFDLVLLGLGDDGHTASLLPGSRLIHERERLVAVTDLQREGTTRLTFTPPLLRNASLTLVLVAGADKARAVLEVLNGPLKPGQLPAQVLLTGRRAEWHLDAAADSLFREQLRAQRSKKGPSEGPGLPGEGSISGNGDHRR